MAEIASTGSGNSDSEFVLKPREEEHLLKGTERKNKSKKRRKNKDIEEKKWNATRLLYNETPSDEYVEENECVLPSPKKVKPPPFSKVWSDEDEISILRGMIKFKDETGRDAGQNMVEFRSFILESLIRQATLVQLREKVRRLREKYEKSLERGNSPTTPHEVQLFQLCQKIWSEHPNSSEQHNIPEKGQQNIVVKENHNIIEKGKPEKQNPPVKEKHNITEKGKPEKQNPPVKEKHGIPESEWTKQQNIPEIGRLRQQIIEQHKIIPATGLDGQTLEVLFQRVSKDMELVVNSKPCLRGNKKEVGIRVLDLCLQNNKVRLKLATLVQEKVNSPELRDFPELLEQEVLRAYLEAKMEHAQLLLNAYNSFIKATISSISYCAHECWSRDVWILYKRGVVVVPPGPARFRLSLLLVLLCFIQWKFPNATEYYFPVGVISLLGLEKRVFGNTSRMKI